MMRLTLPLMLTWLALQAAGCALPDPQRYDTPERRGRAIVVFVPGALGYEEPVSVALDSLATGGVDGAVQVFDWCVHVPLLGGVLNLTDETRARSQGRELAAHLARCRRLAPDRPVRVIGHSAGAAVAVFALEGLPAGVQVDDVVLLSASLDPAYDLTAAVAGVSGGLTTFHSSEDWAMMRGTTVLGTTDRKFVPAAGGVGFRRPESRDPVKQAAFRRVRQIAWRPEWAKLGHDGGHLGMIAPAFVARVLAPLVK